MLGATVGVVRRLLSGAVGLVVVMAASGVTAPVAYAADTTPATATVETTVPFSAGESYNGETAVPPATDAANRALAKGCASGRPIYRPHWHRYTPTQTTVIRPEASLTTSDTGEPSFTGSGVAVLTSDQDVIDCESGNDVEIAGPVTVPAGTTVFVVLFATWEPCSECIYEDDVLSLLVKAAVPVPINDDWQNATPIATLPFSQTVDISSATVQDVDRFNLAPCSATPFIYNARPVWWRFTPIVSGPLDITIGQPGSSQLAFAELTPSGPKYLPLDCDSTQQPKTFKAGTTYLIQAGIEVEVYSGLDFVGLGGPITLSIKQAGKTRLGRSNLVVRDVTASPTSPRPGQQVRFSATVRNTGIAPTQGGVTNQVKFSVGGRPVNFSDTWDGSLAEGESVTLSSNPSHGGPGTWPATVGAHNLRAYADDLQQIEEWSEGDNSRSTVLKVAGTPAQAEPTSAPPAPSSSGPSRPDLVVTHITWSPRSPKAGAAVRFTATVQNRGTRSTPPGSPVRVSFRPNGATKGATVGIGSRIRPGSSATITADDTWTAAKGSTRIVALLDAYKVIAETDDANNTTETYLTTR